MLKTRDPYSVFRTEIATHKAVWPSMMDESVPAGNLAAVAGAASVDYIYILGTNAKPGVREAPENIETFAECNYIFFKDDLLKKVSPGSIANIEAVGCYIDGRADFESPIFCALPDRTRLPLSSTESGSNCETLFDKKFQKRPEQVAWHDQKRERKLISRLGERKRVRHLDITLQLAELASSVDLVRENQYDTLVARFQYFMHLESERELSPSEKAELLETERKLDEVEMSSDAAKAALQKTNANLQKLNQLIELNKKLLEFLG